MIQLISLWILALDTALLLLQSIQEVSTFQASATPLHRQLRTSCLWGKKRKRRSSDALQTEKDLEKRGFFPIIGSDEVGRGCVAGPVVAVSIYIRQNFTDYIPIPGVTDSKELLPEQRERIFEEVASNPDVYDWRVAERSHLHIDDTNILIATMECFRESIETLVNETLPSDESLLAYSIVDGKKSPKLSVSVPCIPKVKGDKSVYTVSLASIVAKVTRDRMAEEWDQLYPKYGFLKHKGYATKDHVEAIHTYGPCPIHRMSFKTLKGRSSLTAIK